MKASPVATAILAFVSTMAAVPAFAAAQAQASIGPISYTLTDLDLNDGITPSLTFLDTVTSLGYVQGGTGFVNIPSPSPWAPVRTQSVSGTSAADFQISNSSNWGLQGMSFSASGSAWGGVNDSRFQVMAYGLYETELGVPQFTLTPNSAVTFETVASLSTSVDGDGPLGSARGEIAFGLLGTSDQLQFMQFSASNLPDVNLPLSQSASQLMSLHLENASSNFTDGALKASFDLSGYVQGAALPAVVTAVPEPETWALMVSGLALVAGMSRRRRQGAPR